MEFTTIITFLLAALLLSGCIAASEKTGEKTGSVAVKNENKNTAREKNIGAGKSNASTNRSGVTPATTMKSEPASNAENATAAQAENKTASPADAKTENKTIGNASSEPAANAPEFVLVYFHSFACPFSPNATVYVGNLSSKYPQIGIEKYEIYYNGSNFELLKQYASKYNLKDEEFVVPIVFLNDTYLAGPDIYSGLEKKIANLTEGKTKK